MIAKITALFTALAIMIGSFSLIFEPEIPKAYSEQELLDMGGVLEKKPLGNEVYAVNVSGYSSDELMTVTALQGIVAKTNPCIYLYNINIENAYLDEIKKSGKTVIYDNDGSPWTLELLIEKFKPFIGDSGYVKYRESEFAEGLNVATNFAAAYGWLPVQEKTEVIARNCGLVMKKDISGEEYDYKFQQKYWEELKDFFKKGMVFHESYRMIGLRDLAIQQGMYSFYTQLTTEGKSLLKEVLAWSGKNTIVLGWTETEKHFVSYISKLGCCIIPSDFCLNTSYHSSFESAIPELNVDAAAHSDATKHYATIVFSDGDNCQWIQNGFSEFYTVQSNYPDSPITWTFPAILQDLCPAAVKKTYSSVEGKQRFIAGPSGIGYCLPSEFDSEAFDLMSARAASAMLKSNIRVMSMIDDYTIWKDAKLEYKLGYFSRFDNIDGGILFLDPDGYRSGKGKVWFSDDKPFASVRMSLWADGGYDGATDEWIKERAEVINNYPVDINSINGYSVICVHAWSMKPASIQKFIDSLDDHVEILSVQDFLKTMQENIPHKNAVPEECYR